MGDAMVRRRSRHSGDRRRQGDFSAGACRGRPLSRPSSTSSTRCCCFPFVGVFERVLSRVGRTDAEDIEDYSTPEISRPQARRRLCESHAGRAAGNARVICRPAHCSSTSRAAKDGASDPGEHYLATDILSRDIRAYTASLLKEDLPYEQLDLVASLIEEADFTAALAESLHQVARRVKREKFGTGPGDRRCRADKLDTSLRDILPDYGVSDPSCRPAMSACPKSRNCVPAPWHSDRMPAPPNAARSWRCSAASNAPNY